MIIPKEIGRHRPCPGKNKQNFKNIIKTNNLWNILLAKSWMNVYCQI